MLSAIAVSFVLGADRLYGCGRLASAETATLIRSLSNSISQPFAQKATFAAFQPISNPGNRKLLGSKQIPSRNRRGSGHEPVDTKDSLATDETVRALIMHYAMVNRALYRFSDRIGWPWAFGP
jgi:hypothetical protein